MVGNAWGPSAFQHTDRDALYCFTEFSEWDLPWAGRERNSGHRYISLGGIVSVVEIRPMAWPRTPRTGDFGGASPE